MHKIIDVRGCFWHQHKDCIDCHIPKSKTKYWNPKLKQNVLRDRRNLKKLKAAGWKVLILWECELDNQLSVAKQIKAFLGRPRRITN
jgi:DNA mismatch endonuclease, patch repair protein